MALKRVYEIKISTGNGEGGIRTRGELSPTQHFQCCTFGRSVTSPKCVTRYFACVLRLLISANFLPVSILLTFLLTFGTPDMRHIC